MSTLYRNYRPQKFSEILGQNHIKITLQNEVSAGRPAGAYLFCGPRAVGKTTMARILAKAVNCASKTDGFEPCSACASCLSIATGSNLDVVEIDAASNTGVDNIRENIISFSRLSPTGAKYKVFIIDEVHMLSISAFNALLKIIEEPPAYVIFILCTTEIQKVPATIVSRCERFDFRRVSISDVVKKLSFIARQEGVSINNNILEAVARRSGGHLRDAESLLGQIFSLGDKNISAEQAELVMPYFNNQEAINFVEHLERKDAAKAISLINSLVDSGVNIKMFVNEIVSLFRKMLLGKLNPDLEGSLGLDWGPELEKKIAPIAAKLSPEQLIAMMRRLMEVASNVGSPMIPQLPLEIAVGELCLDILYDKKSDSGEGLLAEKPSVTLKAGVKKNLALKDEAKPVGKTAVNKDLKIEEVLAKWPEVLVKIKKHNHSLSFVLQNCLPEKVDNGCLNLVFKYKFHQNRVKDQNISPIVSQVLEDVFGSGTQFTSSLNESLSLSTDGLKNEEESRIFSDDPASTNKEREKLTEGGPSGLMSDLLKTFGGEVIN